MSKNFVSPLAIDLGATNTGVYFAHYLEGSSPSKIQRKGKVYQLKRDSYKLLMNDRTAKRHQRRGFKRRKMVKRLLKLIWQEHFRFPWDEDTQKTLSFLIGRRGFSFLTEEYDEKQLSQFPQEAYDKLPPELKKGEYDFHTQIMEWAKDEDALTQYYGCIEKKTKEAKRNKDLAGAKKKTNRCSEEKESPC